MIIPEDGSLPKITRKGFAAFNNIMLIRVPDKLLKPGETTYQLATLDRSKKGERWPADKYVDVMLDSPIVKETSSDKNSSNYNEDDVKKARKYGKFLPRKFETKKFNNFSEMYPNQKVNSSTPPVVSIEPVNFKHHFIPNAFQDPQVSHRSFHGDNHVQYNERTFDDDAHTYRYCSNKFSDDHQSYGGHDNVLGEGTSLNPLANRYDRHNNVLVESASLNPFASRYGEQSHASATVSIPQMLDPAIRDRAYNGDFDFREKPPLYPGPFVPNPQENNFHRPEISNPNFGQNGRNADEPYIQNVPNAYERQMFPPYIPDRPEFMNNNNFEAPPFHHDPMGPVLNNGFNAGNNLPLLPSPPIPPFDNFNNGQFQNKFNRRNPRYDQESWTNHNQPNPHYHRKGHNGRVYKKSWRGRGAPHKFSQGNNNRRVNNRYERKEPS